MEPLPDDSDPRRAPGLRPLALVAAALSLLAAFWTLGLLDVTNVNEGQRLQPAAEMLETGDWIVPRIDGDPYINKPPLVYWILAGAYAVAGGAGVLAGRVVVALISLGVIAATGWLAWRRRRDGWTGPLAAIVLVTGVYYQHKIQQAEIDPVLVGAILGCAHCVWLALSAGGLRGTGVPPVYSAPPDSRERLEDTGGTPVPHTRGPRAWLAPSLAAGVFGGLAFLLKGPVLFPFLIPALIAAHVVARPGWRRTLAVAGVALAGTVLIAAPWCIALVRALGWDQVWNKLHVESIERLGKASRINSGPLWFYLIRVVPSFLPWSAALAFLATRAGRRAFAEADPWFRFAGWFSLFSFVVFSVIRGKETEYLMPMFPFLAVVCAELLDRMIRVGQASCLSLRTRSTSGRRSKSLKSALGVGTLGGLEDTGEDARATRMPWRVVRWTGFAMGLGSLAAPVVMVTELGPYLQSSRPALSLMIAGIACGLATAGLFAFAPLGESRRPELRWAPLATGATALLLLILSIQDLGKLRNNDLRSPGPAARRLKELADEGAAAFRYRIEQAHEVWYTRAISGRVEQGGEAEFVAAELARGSVAADMGTVANGAKTARPLAFYMRSKRLAGFQERFAPLLAGRTMGVEEFGDYAVVTVRGAGGGPAGVSVDKGDWVDTVDELDKVHPASSSSSAPASTLSTQSTLSTASTQSAPPAPPIPLASIFPAAPRDLPPGLAAHTLFHTPNSIAFLLEVGAGTHASDLTDRLEPLAFCVPPDRELSLSVIGARVGVPSGAGAASNGESYEPPPGSYEILRLGYLRRWPAAIVRFRPEFFDAAGRLDDESLARSVEARLEIHWSEPASLAGAPARPDDLEPDSPWDGIARSFFTNPAGLRHFQQAAPPLRAGIDPRPTDLPRQIPSPSSGGEWLRLRLEGDGLFRIDRAALAKFPGWALPPVAGASPEDALATPRVFLDGRPAPLLRHGAEMILRNEANPSRYSKERVYRLFPERLFEGEASSSDPMSPSFLLEAGDMALLAGDARLTTTTLLVAERARAESLVIDYGVFREVRGLGWAEAELSPEAPFEFDLPSAGAPFVRGTARLELRFRTVFAERVAGDPPLSPGLAVTVAFEDGTTTTVALESGRTPAVEVPMDAGALSDGAASLSLRLAGPLPDGVSESWFEGASAIYAGAPAMIDGATTIRAMAHDADGSVRWTPLTPPPGPLPASGEGEEDTPDLVAIDPDFEGGPRAMPLETRDGVLGVRWIARPGARVEVRDAATIPVVSDFELERRDDLLADTNEADLLVIAHASLIEPLTPLVEARRAQGLRVRVADVQAIYDAFSHGASTPEAIRDLLAWSLLHWRRAPSSVLLVGDCTSDFRDETRMGVPNLVPTHPWSWKHGRIGPNGPNDAVASDGSDESDSDEPDASVEFTETAASDAWYGLVAGDDLLPDFVVSRLPASNPDDLRAMVSNALRYATETPTDEPPRVVLVADNAREFERVLEGLAARDVPDWTDLRRVYLSRFPFVDNRYAPDEMRRAIRESEGRWMKLSDAATAALEAELRAGAPLVEYMGHGSPNLWADERMWFGGGSESSDSLRLRDAGRWSFVVNHTCNAGAIDYPIRPWNVNLLEDMMRVPGGGAIGAFASSGPGRTPLQESMARRLHRALFEDGMRRIGDATTLARARFVANGAPGGFLDYFTEEFALGYVALGDPMVELAIARPSRRSFEQTGETARDTASASIQSIQSISSIQSIPPTDPPPPPGPARLRIVPDSIRTSPESPSEGWTITVSLEIENAGGEPSPPAVVRLFEDDPVAFVTDAAGAAGAAKSLSTAYDHNRSDEGLPNEEPIPALAPGARARVELRWDPSFNAGPRDVWARLDPLDEGGVHGARASGPHEPGSGQDARAPGESPGFASPGFAPPEERLARATVVARSRAKLGYRNVRSEGSAEDLAAGRMKLHAEVVNDGETAARGVSVAFFKGRNPTPANRIHETVLEEVPPMSSIPVEHLWTFSGLGDLVDDKGNAGFMIQVWIKGSRMRMSSESVPVR